MSVCVYIYIYIQKGACSLLTLLDLCLSSLRRGHAKLSLYRSKSRG